MIKQGSWWIRSQSDPRWNAHGTGLVGGFVLPEGAKDKIEALKALYGEPPADLDSGYMKD